MTTPAASPVTASPAEGYAFCTHLAETHYENFPVGRLVPRKLKKHVHAVYAFARIADDLADEGYHPESGQTSSDDWERNRTRDPGSTRVEMDEAQRIAALDEWEAKLTAPHEGPRHPVFAALHATIDELDLPLSLFTDLLSAFRQDVVKRRYASHAEVLDYCRRSANPIGRLVLLLHAQREPRQHELSDHICTALQLANFWQDVAVDLDKDRIYLPQDDLERFGVSEANLRPGPGRGAPDAYRRLLRFQVERTQDLFDAGEPLMATLPGRLRYEIRLTWLGGTSILRKIEDQDYDTLSQRPRLAKRDFLALLAQTLFNP
ncbi:MAG: squalene synthase HpnC [Verrucomicrobiota bacterium]